MSFFHEIRDHFNLMRDMVDCSRFFVGRQHIECPAIALELFGPEIGELFEPLIGTLRIPDGLVIDIRKVPNVKSIGPPQFQNTAEHILK